jgi:hypothetical protein
MLEIARETIGYDLANIDRKEGTPIKWNTKNASRRREGDFGNIDSWPG